MDGSYTPTRPNQYGLFEPPVSQSTEFINKREGVAKPRKFWTRRRKVWFVLVIGLVVVAVAVAVPVAILVPRHNNATVVADKGGRGNTTGGANANATAAPTDAVSTVCIFRVLDLTFIGFENGWGWDDNCYRERHVIYLCKLVWRVL